MCGYIVLCGCEVGRQFGVSLVLVVFTPDQTLPIWVEHPPSWVFFPRKLGVGARKCAQFGAQKSLGGFWFCAGLMEKVTDNCEKSTDNLGLVVFG